MRNRAKCKLCGDIIESYHPSDYVHCKCDQIAVDGGASMRCYAKDFNNFVRVDDNDNEIVTQYVDNKQKEEDKETKKASKKEILAMLEDLIKSYDNLPEHALLSPVSHADMQSALMIIFAIVRK